MVCARRRSSSVAVPVSNCSLTRLYEARAVSSVRSVTASRSSSASTVRYCTATWDTSRISAALRACAEAKYCWSAASDRLRRRPKKSISHDAVTPTSQVPMVCPLPGVDRPAGVRWRVPSAKPETCGNSADALDAVLRLGRRDIQHGHAEIAVVLERDLDEPLQARIGHEIAPADVGRRDRRAARLAGRLVCRAGRIRRTRPPRAGGRTRAEASSPRRSPRVPRPRRG